MGVSCRRWVLKAPVTTIWSMGAAGGLAVAAAAAVATTSAARACVPNIESPAASTPVASALVVMSRLAERESLIGYIPSFSVAANAKGRPGIRGQSAVIRFTKLFETAALQHTFHGPLDSISIGNSIGLTNNQGVYHYGAITALTANAGHNSPILPFYHAVLAPFRTILPSLGPNVGFGRVGSLRRQTRIANRPCEDAFRLV